MIIAIDFFGIEMSHHFLTEPISQAEETKSIPTNVIGNETLAELAKRNIARGIKSPNLV